MKKTLYFLITFSLLNSSCKQAKHPDWKTLDKPEFSVQYPPNWIESETGAGGTTFILEPADSANNKMHLLGINLTVRPANAKDIDIKKLSSMMRDELSKKIPGINIIESEVKKGSGGDFYKLHFQADLMNFSLECEQYLWLKNNKSYVLTFRGIKSTFPQYQETEEDVLNSFKLK